MSCSLDLGLFSPAEMGDGLSKFTLTCHITTQLSNHSARVTFLLICANNSELSPSAVLFFELCRNISCFQIKTHPHQQAINESTHFSISKENHQIVEQCRRWTWRPGSEYNSPNFSVFCIVQVVTCISSRWTCRRRPRWLPITTVESGRRTTAPIDTVWRFVTRAQTIEMQFIVADTLVLRTRYQSTLTPPRSAMLPHTRHHVTQMFRFFEFCLCIFWGHLGRKI